MSVIIEILRNYFSYTQGERVCIVRQDFDASFPESYRFDFEQSAKVCALFESECQNANIPIRICSYVPTALRNGQNPPDEFIAKYFSSCSDEIIVMPTVFSLTHTSFCKNLSKIPKKVATIPGAKLCMFKEGGAMTFVPQMLDLTKKYYDLLTTHNYCRVTAADTNIVFSLFAPLVHHSDGICTLEGESQNIPGAESYCVPKDANGYFTIQPGYGGDFAVSVPTKFVVENCFIVDVISSCADEVARIKANLANPNWNKVAELGIGTNPAIDFKIASCNGWSTLLGEKIYGTAHIAHGNSKAMGGDNDVPIHIDWVIADAHFEFFE
jgi:leucyl aminopeptidase (aminopeptidase T)